MVPQALVGRVVRQTADEDLGESRVLLGSARPAGGRPAAVGRRRRDEAARGRGAAGAAARVVEDRRADERVLLLRTGRKKREKMDGMKLSVF